MIIELKNSKEKRKISLLSYLSARYPIINTSIKEPTSIILKYILSDQLIPDFSTKSKQ